MKMLKVGIIGTGFGAKVHAPLFQEHPSFEVQAIASVSRGNVEGIRSETGISNVYADWKAMLEQEELDVVSIVSAPYLHREMVIEAFRRGCHVLCEKPMAFDSAEAVQMLEARDRSGKLGFINFEWRFLPARLAVKEIMDSGRLGEITNVRYDWTIGGYQALIGRSFGWLMQEDKAGGMLGAIGSHMFDSLSWWLNDEVKELFGQLSTHVPEYRSESGETEIRTADNAFEAVGRFRSGIDFSAGFMYGSRHSIGTKLEIYGTQGTLIVFDDKKVEAGFGGDPLTKLSLSPESEAPDQATDIVKRYYASFKPMVDHLYEAMGNGQISPLLPTFEDGLRVQRVLDAIRKSSKEGQRITL